MDDDILLKKIKTEKSIIHFNNSRILSEDTRLFIQRLKDDAVKYNIKIIDSWDEIAEKGYLKIAYNFSSFILILSITLVIVATIFKGFHPFFLSVLLLFIPKAILYKRQIRHKIH